MPRRCKGRPGENDFEDVNAIPFSQVIKSLCECKRPEPGFFGVSCPQQRTDKPAHESWKTPSPNASHFAHGLVQHPFQVLDVLLCLQHVDVERFNLLLCLGSQLRLSVHTWLRVRERETLKSVVTLLTSASVVLFKQTVNKCSLQLPTF